MAQQWIKVAGSFPATLVKDSDPSTLKINESPSAYGLNADTPGYLARGTCPTPATAIGGTYIIGSTTYKWWYNRLWRMSGKQLIYGAPEYTGVYLAQGLGHIDFNDTTGDIIDFLPIGKTSMLVLKSNCFYLVQNAEDHDGKFVVTHYNQAIGVATAGQAVDINGLVYLSNADGLSVIQETGESGEVTLLCRASIGPFANKILKADYTKERVVGISGTDNVFCYDTVRKTLFDYTSDGTTVTTGFLYTTPTLTMRKRGNENASFTVDAVAFEILTTDDQPVRIGWQLNCGQRGWGDDQTFDMDLDRNEYGDRIMVQLDVGHNGRSFAMRLTEMPTNLKIKNIFISSDDYELEGLAE